jgi:hypothetical protein
VALQEEWANLDLAYVHKLYNSIPSRILALHKSKGHYTRY